MIDAVFGRIELTSLCTAFADTPEHHRLSHIAMNNAHVLYPSASYSRREHCFSTMALARRLSSRLTTDSRLVDLIALAGLYHDVGHLTLSHTLDVYLTDTLGLQDHEARSVAILYRVNKRLKLLTPTELEFVCGAITCSLGSSRPYERWAYHIVHQPDRSLPDVDRIAYLCHDQLHTGFPLTIDVDRVIRSAYVDNEGKLQYTEDSQQELENIVQSRDRMFTCVFHHNIVTAYQNYLLSRFVALFGQKKLYAMFTDVETCEWLTLTDVLLWSTLYSDPDTKNAIETRAWHTVDV
jgi:HD superfamily phosphohydrolase